MNSLSRLARVFGLGFLALMASLASAQPTVTVTPASPTFTSAGGDTTFNVTLTYPGTMGSLGFEMTLPAGWKYVTQSGNSGIPPSANTVGKIQFAWISGFGSPVSFSFVVNAPAGLTVSQTFTEIVGRFVDTEANETAISAPNVALSLAAAPVFTSANTATFVVGQANTFTVTASGGPAPTLALASGTLPTGVTFTPATGILSGNPSAFTGSPFALSFSATNASGSVSQSFTLNVNGAPTFGTHPADRTVLAGQSASFTVATAGNPAPTIQWQGQEPGTTTWSPLGASAQFSGVTSTTLTVTTNSGLDGWKFRAVASNGVNPPANSNPATLTVQYAPSFALHPQSQTVNLGASVSFSATAVGNPAPTIQWRLNGGTTAVGSGPTLTINPAAAANAGSYVAVATNSVGEASSNPALLSFTPSFAGFTPTSGPQATSVTLNGSGFTGAKAVRFNGETAPFTVVSDFQITTTVPTFAATGNIAITRADDSVLTSSTVFTVLEGRRIVAVSTRASTQGGENSVMANFTIEGTAAKSVLVRAVGPGLATFGVAGVLPDPVLFLHDGSGAMVAQNDNWDSALASVFSSVGAFALTAGSKDAALSSTLAPGTYTARVDGVGTAAGEVLLEVYEAAAASRIAHSSTRANVASGGTHITGLSVGGTGTTGSKTFLIRAVGSSLGVPGAMANPVVTVFTGSTQVATNDNFGTNANLDAINAATAAVGAMPLAANDAAVLVTLPGGSHSVQVTGAAGSAGIVLAEIFVVDSFLPTARPPALLAPLARREVNLGTTVTFAAPFLGRPNPSLQWQKAATAGGPFTDIGGATGKALAVTVAGEPDLAFYRVALTAGATTLNSAPAQIDVIKAPQTITFGAISARPYSPGATFSLSATASSNLAVTFASSDASVASVSATGTVTINGVGSTTITASQGGNGVYSPAPDVARTLVVNKGTATVSLADLNAVFDGSPKAVTATTSNPSGLTVAVTYTAPGGSPTATAPTNAGSYGVNATVTGSALYEGTASGTLVIGKAPQTITFGTLDPKTFGDPDFSVSATTTSPGAVVFSSDNPAVAIVTGTTVKIVGAGTAGITATEPGGPNYLPATPVVRTLNVAKAAQALTFPAIADKVFGVAPFALSASASSGLFPTFSVISGPATVAGNVLTITGAGAVTVRAAQVGSANFEAATSIDRTFSVAKADQSIDFPLPVSLALDQSPFILPGAATSNLALTFTTANPVPTTGTHAVATINGNVLALVGTGKIDITASQTGNGNFNPATAVTRTLIVNSQSQTLTFAATELPNKVFGDADFTIRASSNRALEITFVTDNPGVAIVIPGTKTGNETTATVKIVGAGTAKISATQLGTADTSAAPPIERTLTVAKANQTTTFAALANKVFLDAPFVLNATTSSTLPPVFTVVSGPATIDSATNTVTLTGAGNVTIRAAQPGNANYNAAANVDRTFSVAKADQTLTFAAVGPKLRSDSPFGLAATASSNLTAVTFTSSSTNVASVTGNTVTIRGLGTTTLTATQAGDANFNPGSATQVLTVNPDSPVISSIPSATVRGVKGSPLLFGPIGINAGAAPYTFAIASGSALPPGLTINAANGNIGGTPTATGTFNAMIVVNNVTLPAPTANSANSRAVAFTIDPAVPAFPTTPLAGAGVVGTAYTGFAAPTLVDGNTGVTFSATGLPAGLTINPTTGAITGTPTAAGSFTVQLSATNSTGAVTVPVSLTITTPANAPVYSGPTNPSGKVGVAFSFTPNFGDAGTSPTTYAPITTGLPPGVTFNTGNGLFSGTPTAAGSYPVTVQATRVGVTVSVSLTFVINPPDVAPVVGFPSGANPLVLRAGSAAPAGLQLTATPATPTSTFAATGLPAGLSLSSGGLLSGTTTVVGTVDVKVTATTTGGSPVSGPAASWRISVQPAVTAPVISSPAVVGGQVGVALTHLLTTSTTTATPAFSLMTIGLPSGISATLPAGLTIAGTTIVGSPTSAGTTKVIIVATADGLTGPGQELTFTIAPAANVPIVNSNGSATGTVGQTFSYQITATNGPLTGYSLSPRSTLPAGLSFNGTTGVIFGVPSAPTSNPVIVDMLASNASGASSAKELAITIVAPPTAPVIANAGATVVGRVGVALTAYQISASETPTAYAATGLPAGVVLSGTTGLITGTPTASGTFTAQVSAGNAAAGFGPSAPLFFTIAASAAAPVIGGTAPSAGRVGTAFSYQIVASNSPSSYALTGTLPAGLALNSSTGLIFGTPTEPGLFSISVTASNDGGTSLPQSFPINIQAAQTAPVITSAATATATVGQAFVYDIAATNVAATRPLVPPEALDAVNLPAGLAANPAMGRIEGVPTTVGFIRASLVGTNAAGQGPARDLLIDVLPAPSAPVVTSGTAASGQVGVAFSYLITASGKPDSYEVLNAPAWLTVNTSTGAVSGVPVEPGPINVSVVARSGSLASSPSPLAIDVAAAAGAPIITSSRAAFGAVGAAFSFPVSASGTGTITYSAQGLPANLSINAASGVISGTSNASGVFSVRLTARNASGVSYPVTLTLTITPSFQIN
jgi:hypothetical protein